VTEQKHRVSRRLAAIAAGLLTLMLSAAVAARADEPAAAVSPVPDGRIKLQVITYGYNEDGELRYLSGAIQARDRVVWNGDTIDVGSQVDATVIVHTFPGGLAYGEYPATWRFAGWSQRAVDGPDSGETTSAAISFGGVSDRSADTDHYLFLRYDYHW
jgi:hypothetical protein